MLAATTDEAEDCLSRHRPSTDPHGDAALPGEGGLSLVRRLRSAGDSAMSIIAVTAHAMPGDRREVALEAGCDGYLTQPVELRQLLSVVLSHLPEQAQEALP